MRLLRHLIAAALILLPAAALSQGQVSAPRVTTRPSNDNSTFAASTAYVDLAVQVVQSALSSRAPLNSPQFTGNGSSFPTLRLLPVAGQNLGLILNQTLSGSATGALSGNYLAATDTAVASAPDVTTFWNMAHVIGAGVQGHRNTFQLVTTINGADNGVTNNPYYVTFGPATVVNAGDNGTVDGSTGKVSYTSGRGAYFVGNPVLKAFNAPNIQELSVYEYNISADANTTVAYKSLLALVPLASDKSQGTVKDDMITLSAQPGAVGSRVLINASASHGAVPFNSGSTVLKAAGGTLLNGVDFTGLTIAGKAFASPGFSVDGAGALTAGVGTFIGALSAPSAALSGALTASSASLTGALNAGTGVFTGALSAPSASLSGALSASSASLTGALTTNSIALPYSQITDTAVFLRLGHNTGGPVLTIQGSAASSGALNLHGRSGLPPYWETPGDFVIRSNGSGTLDMNFPTQTTAPSAGSAGALPSAPKGYLKLYNNGSGNPILVAYY